MLNTSLVSIATDTLSLEGAWYEPAGRKARGAALLFHGNTVKCDHFYRGHEAAVADLVCRWLQRNLERGRI